MNPLISNINWDAVSSISNIVLSILTLVAVVITYITLVVNTKSKAKIESKFDVKPSAKFHKIRLVNQREVPITVIHKGFYIYDKQDREIVVHGEKVNQKLHNSDVIYHTTNIKTINARLKRNGYQDGETIYLYGYFIVTDIKRKYVVKIKHKIETEEKPSIQLK